MCTFAICVFFFKTQSAERYGKVCVFCRTVCPREWNGINIQKEQQSRMYPHTMPRTHRHICMYLYENDTHGLSRSPV